MENMIKGYQYRSNNRYGGVYEFPNNLDKVEIHMPPNTTLVAPPDIPEGKEALWDGKGWSLVDEEVMQSVVPEPVVIEPIANTEPSLISN